MLARRVRPQPDTPLGLRNRAILLAGFGGALRRSEIVALDAGDLEFVDGRGVVLTVRRSKTDQHGAGAAVAIWRSDDPDLLPPPRCAAGSTTGPPPPRPRGGAPTPTTSGERMGKMGGGFPAATCAPPTCGATTTPRRSCAIDPEGGGSGAAAKAKLRSQREDTPVSGCVRRSRFDPPADRSDGYDSADVLYRRGTPAWASFDPVRNHTRTFI